MVSYVETNKIALILKILFVMINLKTKFDDIFLFDWYKKRRFSIKSNEFVKLSSLSLCERFQIIYEDRSKSSVTPYISQYL